MNLFSLTNKRIVKAAVRKWLLPVVTVFVLSLLTLHLYLKKSAKETQGSKQQQTIQKK